MKHALALPLIAAFTLGAAAHAQSTYHPGAPQLDGAGHDRVHERSEPHARNDGLAGGPDHRDRRREARGGDYRGYMVPPDYRTRNTAEPFWYHMPGAEACCAYADRRDARDRGPAYGDEPQAEDGYIYHSDGTRTPVEGRHGRRHAEGYAQDRHHRDGYGEPEFREGSDRPGHYWSERSQSGPYGERYEFHERYADSESWENETRWGRGPRGPRVHGSVHRGPVRAYEERWPIVLGEDFLYGPMIAGSGYRYDAGGNAVAWSRTYTRSAGGDGIGRLPSAGIEARRRGLPR